ncbi:uncharacterized protein LOC136034880 isoform X2 [Artemia franciscana]|uniref:uncharacterized protein LOC136034880 isoform X2 n=1 Tax=Artemia franciscana TaxID=6661 RepID=UPI0032DBB055
MESNKLFDEKDQPVAAEFNYQTSPSSSIIVVNEKSVLLPEELQEGLDEFFETDNEENIYLEELNRTSLVMMEQKELLSSWQNNFERLNLTYIQKIEEITQSLEKAEAENQSLRKQLNEAKCICQCCRDTPKKISNEGGLTTPSQRFVCPQCHFNFQTDQALLNHATSCLDVVMFPE